MTNKSNVNSLASLQKRKAELKGLCKEKEKAIEGQVDYIGEHLGSIVLRTFVSSHTKKDKSVKADIISLLVSEGIETAFDIKQDPHNIKDKMVGFVKKTASGVINLIVK